MARGYVQRARAESAAITRRRVVEAARVVHMDGEVPRLGLAEVAQRAGIARSTLYLSFGTRSALMTAILDDSLNRAGFEQIREYLALPDAIEAMEKTLAQAAAMYATDYAVLRRMLRDLAQRLRDQQRLRAGVSAGEASAILWLLTSFDTFDQLFSGWNLDARTCGTRIVAMARSSLL